MKKHNKSGLTYLSLLENDDKTIDQWYNIVMERNIKVQGFILGSRCLQPNAKDGRLSIDSKKVAYGYQVVAFRKFGRNELSKVAACKGDNDITVSHLCGTRNCENENHLILETKKINDQRTHCHYVLKNIRKHNNEKKLTKKEKWHKYNSFLELGSCPHIPPCCQLWEDIVPTSPPYPVQSSPAYIEPEPTILPSIIKPVNDKKVVKKRKWPISSLEDD